MNETGNREISYLDAVREALTQEMRRDPEVFLLGEDIGVYGGAFGATRGMLEEFGPERVRDTPISEAGIAGVATGAAMMGMRPVMEIMFMDFLTISMNQLVNQAAKIRFMFGGKASIPLDVRAPAGSGTGAAAQHCQSLEAWLINVPGIKVVAPATPYDVKGLLKAAIRGQDPVLFIEHATLYQARGEVPEGEVLEPIGVSKVQRPGRDVTIVTYSKMLQSSLQAAERLAQEGIEAEVIDLRTLRPLDMGPVIESFKKTNRAVVAEEGWRSYGIGAEVSARIYEAALDYVDAPIQRVAQKEVPLPYNRTLEQAALPQVADIVAAVKEVMK